MDVVRVVAISEVDFAFALSCLPQRSTPSKS